MTRLKIIALLCGIAFPFVGTAAGVVLHEGQRDQEIKQLFDQEKDMQQDIKWLIRHTPDGQQYLDQRHKSANDEMDMLQRPTRQDATIPPLAR